MNGPNELFKIGILVVLLIVALAVGGKTATLEVTWNANQETDLAGYKVYYKASNATAWSTMDAGKVLKVDIPNMAENLEYCAQVTAYDTSGNESAKSVAACDILDTIPPGAPTGVKAKILKLIAWLKGLWG